jgi:hypothetical protein
VLLLKVAEILGMTTTEKAKQNIMAKNSIVANVSQVAVSADFETQMLNFKTRV